MAKQDLHFSITATNEDLKRKLAESRQAIIESGKTAEAQASRIDGSFKRMAVSAAAGFSAISLGKSIIRVRGEIQMMETSFEVLLGSKAKATKMIAEIKQLAIDSPLEMPQVSGAVQVLLGFGVEAEKVMGIVGQLSDVAMGDADRFRSLALVYAQTQSAGKLMGQDLLQMINAGFNPLSVIAEKTGKSIGQLKKEMESGAISAEMVADAFATVTSEGGMFYQMTQKQASGIVGLQATFEDAITNQMNKFGEKNEDLIASGYKFATSVVENADTIVAALIPIITTYGVYKASVIAVNAVGKVKESSFAAVEIAELSKLLPLKAQEANADITTAVAKGQLSQATAERLIAIRAEVAAELEGLKAKALAAQKELETAVLVEKNALRRSVTAKQNLALSQSQMQIALKGGNAEEIATAKTAVRTAKIEVNSAARARNTAQQAIGAAQTQVAATATAVDTMQTNVNTASTNAGTTAKNLFTAATARLTTAFHSLKVAFATNPIGMILTGVTMAISLFSMFGNSSKDAAESLSGLEKASKKANEEFDDQRSKIEALQSVMNNSNVAYDERKRALTELKTLIPQYNGELNKEGQIINSNTNAITQYLTQLEKQIKMKAAQEELENVYRNKWNKERELKKQEEKLKKQEESNRNYTAPLGASSFAVAYGNASGEQAAGFTRDRIAAIGRDIAELSNEASELNKEIAATSTTIADVGGAVSISMYGVDYKVAQKEWAAAKKELEKIEKDKNNYTVKQYEDAVERDKKAKAAFEKLGGKTSGQASKASKDYLDEEIAERIELERMKIDLLKDGREKELKQIEQTKNEKIASFQKEQNEIAAQIAKGGLTKEQKAAKTERSGALEAKKGFVNQQATQDSAAVNDKYNKEIVQKEKELTNVMLSEVQRRSDALKTKYDEMREWSNTAFAKGSEEHKAFNVKIDTAEAKEQLEALTTDYQTYGDKRKQIEEKFSADIKALEAKNTNGKLDGNIAAAKKQRDEALNGLKFDEAKEGVDLSKLFGNLDNMTLPSMKELRDKIKIWIDGAGKDLSPEDLKAVSDAFNNLDLKIADKDPFAVMKTSAEDYKKALKEVKKTQKEYDKTKAESKLASDGLAAAEKKLAEAEKEWQAVLANPAKSDIEGVAASVVAAEDEVEAAKQKATAATKKQTDAEKELTTAQNERAAAVAKSTESLQSAANKGQQIVGMAKDILGILDDLGVEVPEQISGAIDGLGQMFDGLASINLNEPLSVVTGAVKALGGAIKVVSSLFNGDSKRERNIAEWQKSIDDLEMQYETLEKAIDKAYSSDASQLMDQSNELLERQKALIQQQKEAEKSKKDPDDGALDSYDDKIDEINEKIEENKEKAIDVIFGADLQSAIDSFASAYVDAWDAGEDRAAAQKDVVKKMIQGIVAEIIKGNIAGKVAELRAALKEAVSDDGVIDEIEQAEIDKLQEEIYAQSAKDAKAYEKSLKGDDTSNDKSMAGQIRGSVATEASVSELGGLFRSQTDSLLRIDAKMDLGFGHLMEIARSNAAIEANTAMTAANTAQTVIALAGGFSSMQIELQAINKNTSKDNGSYGN